jgi:hypothetical protein
MRIAPTCRAASSTVCDLSLEKIQKVDISSRGRRRSHVSRSRGTCRPALRHTFDPRPRYRPGRSNTRGIFDFLAYLSRTCQGVSRPSTFRKGAKDAKFCLNEEHSGKSHPAVREGNSGKFPLQVCLGMALPKQQLQRLNKEPQALRRKGNDSGTGRVSVGIARRFDPGQGTKRFGRC